LVRHDAGLTAEQRDQAPHGRRFSKT
jgi:hypothetical protein